MSNNEFISEKTKKAVEVAVAAILVGWAFGNEFGYDEGWCDRDEGKEHDESRAPSMPSPQQIQEMVKVWFESKEEIESHET